jgi:hypothetical protein
VEEIVCVGADGAPRETTELLRVEERIEQRDLAALGIELLDGHDPNSYFVAGATAADFAFDPKTSRRSKPTGCPSIKILPGIAADADLNIGLDSPRFVDDNPAE